MTLTLFPIIATAPPMTSPVCGRYDWSSWAPMVEAAATAGVQVYWDLFHYGFPGWVEPLSDDFPVIFAD